MEKGVDSLPKKAKELVLEGYNFLRMSDPDSVLYSISKKTLVSINSFLITALSTCTIFVVGVRESPVIGGMSLVRLFLGLQFLLLLT